MNVLGIDPGKSGGIALVREDRQMLFLDSIPTMKVRKSKREYDAQGLVSILDGLKLHQGINLVVLEKTHSMPKQGVSTMFTMGMGFGLVLGIVSALGLPLELADPARWKRDMGITGGTTPKERKACAVLAARRLFPGVQFRDTQHDLAEALLLAEWGMRRLGRQRERVDVNNPPF